MKGRTLTYMYFVLVYIFTDIKLSYIPTVLTADMIIFESLISKDIYLHLCRLKSQCNISISTFFYTEDSLKLNFVMIKK